MLKWEKLSTIVLSHGLVLFFAPCFIVFCFSFYFLNSSIVVIAYRNGGVQCEVAKRIYKFFFGEKKNY